MVRARPRRRSAGLRQGRGAGPSPPRPGLMRDISEPRTPGPGSSQGKVGTGTWKRVWAPGQGGATTMDGVGACRLVTPAEAAGALYSATIGQPDIRAGDDGCVFRSQLSSLDEVSIGTRRNVGDFFSESPQGQRGRGKRCPARRGRSGFRRALTRVGSHLAVSQGHYVGDDASSSAAEHGVGGSAVLGRGGACGRRAAVAPTSSPSARENPYRP